MANEHSGYANDWAKGMTQPAFITSFFPPAASSKQSPSLPHHQSPFFHHAYRDPSGTSVSALETLPDCILHTPPDDSQDPDIDDIAPIPSDELAGIVGGNNFFGMNSLDASFNPSNYSLSSDADLYPSLFTDETPWTIFQSLPPNNPDMTTRNHPHDETPSKRRRLQSDPALPKQTSPRLSAQDSTRRQRQQGHYSSQSNLHTYPSTPATIQEDELVSLHSQEYNPRPIASSARRPSRQSHTSAQQSPPKPTSKATKKTADKHFCSRCSNSTFAGFTTCNDLARHHRGVHGIFEPGDKIWRCQIENCTVADKIWPRRDNFLSHLKRMHFDNDETKARAVVNSFEKAYDSNIHGALESMKAQNPRGSNRTRSSQDASSSMPPPQPVSIPDTPILQQSYMPALTNPNQDMYVFTSISQGPSAVSGASARNSAPRAASDLSSMDRLLTPTHSSSFLTTPHSAQPGRIIARPRPTLSAPNPGSTLRQRQEIHEQNQVSQQTPQTGPSTEDLIMMGQGLGPFDNVNPALLSAPFLESNSGSQRDRDRERDIELMFRSFSPQARARLISRFGEQSQSQSQSQDFFPRSVPKSLMKKKADVEKTLKCDYMIEGKGDMKGKSVTCGAGFTLQSELRKHKKRHDKCFGCTFDGCYSKFGTKWEWKRHELNQHLQAEAWRCRSKDVESNCQQLFSHKSEFENHLTSHFPPDSEVIAREVQECHVSPHFLGSYWCGFCPGIIQSRKEFGQAMYDERVEHIGSHVLHGTRSSNWIELAGDGKTKKEMEERHQIRAMESEVGTTETKMEEEPSQCEDQNDDDDDDDDDDTENGDEGDEGDEVDNEDENETNDDEPEDPHNHTETITSSESNSPSDPPHHFVQHQNQHQHQHPRQTNQRPLRPPLNTITITQGTTMLPSATSQPIPSPTTPSIHIHPPPYHGTIHSANTTVNIHSPLHQNNQQNQHQQPQQRRHSTPRYQQPYPHPFSTLPRICCGCRTVTWPSSTGCLTPQCGHEFCGRCGFVTNPPGPEVGMGFGVFGGY